MGRLAYSPISNDPTTATRIVATVVGPTGKPAALRMAGLTTMI